MKREEIYRKYFPKIVGFGLNTIGVFAPRKAAEVALDVFCTPRRGQVQSYQKKFLKKFKQVTLDFNGLPIMTYDNGKSGKKVLLCHGWESNSFRWRKLYRSLKDEDLNIIMMDAPAHGGTGSDKFQALLYGQMINTVSSHYKPDVILGHSVGGYSSIYYMAQYKPAHVNQLVILASPDKLIDITNRYFKMIGLSSRVGSRYYKLIKERFGNDISTYNAADYASMIDINGLIIHDEEDDINLFYEAEAIHSKWENSKLIPTKGLGHSLQDDSVYSAIASSIL
ncbi:MAG: alpha/beta hydrolase [Saprospiraceae bacterium]|nr:alpha/beta hydrolase [Saprospiraceae bacterium]